MTRERLLVEGVVQGVGFRPFVYKLANDFNLNGYVRNNTSEVEVEVEGLKKNIKSFKSSLLNNLPLQAKIDNITSKTIQIKQSQSFEIKHSQNIGDIKKTLIPNDTATCDECKKDIYDKKSRYYKYFATNCTNCGTRYSIIKNMPYDRANTSMDKFILCLACKKEYKDPKSRRYHAQAISCNDCEIKLYLYENKQKLDLSNQDKFLKISQLISDGKIGAIKGIGGFHIICDATHDRAIINLRNHKNRPSKPLAIMCKDLKQIKQIAKINKKEEELLSSNKAPIVVLNKITTNKISNSIAPNINKIGCFLAYTPLHHLLFDFIKNPLVATSANLKSEPIITNNNDILEKLGFLDFVLDFNREIINPIDDSLLQIIDNNQQTLRLARGYAPKTIKLPFKIKENILALGANSKNSICLAFDDRIIISPYIGELDNIKTFEHFKKTIKIFEKFYNFKADIIICDKHPNYHNTKWAKKTYKNVIQVQHHLAHIYATKAEFYLTKDYLGFSFDGTGYGNDGTLWGGEIFVGDKRKYNFKPIKLLGGHKAIKEPKRVALSMLFEKYDLEEVLNLNIATIKEFSKDEIKILHQSYTKNINSFLSSSVGRLFDGIASLANLSHISSYEGESGLLCENNYDKTTNQCFEYSLENKEISIKYDFFHKDINTLFINTLAKIIVDIAKIEKLDIILSGGVFQNKTLLELIIKNLKQENIKYFIQEQSPVNDGSIALGQIYYYLSKKDK